MSFSGKATYSAGSTLPEIAEDVSDLVAINSLFLHTQPAHLQRHVGKALDGDARKAARAEFVRGRIGKRGLEHKKRPVR